MANRLKQIGKLQTKAYYLAEEIEQLKDELQEAFDNMPENLQLSANGERSEARINLLDNWLDELRGMAEEEVE